MYASELQIEKQENTKARGGQASFRGNLMVCNVPQYGQKKALDLLFSGDSYQKAEGEKPAVVLWTRINCFPFGDRQLLKGDIPFLDSKK